MYLAVKKRHVVLVTQYKRVPKRNKARALCGKIVESNVFYFTNIKLRFNKAMSAIYNMGFISKAWDFVKLDDPSTFKDDYINKTIDRSRRNENRKDGWSKLKFWEYFNLYPSYYSAYERKFLIKFDISVLLFLGASFYTKYLDNMNIGAAYVSGMKEDINITGNELNYFNTMYTVGYALFQIPITLLITRPRYSRYLLIVCEFLWGMLTLSNAFVKTPQQVYVIRFFIGVFEACSYPASYVVFSSYLTEDELFKRAGIYGAFAVAGSASSGLLQTKTLESLSGVGGLAGWRWQFIIDAIITMGIVIYGFFLFPGIPTACKQFGLFTEDDMIFARKRLSGIQANPEKFTMKSIIETLTTWQLYICSFLWVFHHMTLYSNGAKLYMKSEPQWYSTADVTNWDAYMWFVGLGSDIILSPLMKSIGKLKVAAIVFPITYYAAIVLVIWNCPHNVRISAFFLQHVLYDGMSQPIFSWAATLCKDNVEKKALVLSIMQVCSYATNAWAVPIQYNVKYSPRFKGGYIANLAIVIMTNVFYVACWVFDHYDYRFCSTISGHRHELEKDGEALEVTGSSSSNDSNFAENFVTQETVEISSVKRL